MRCCARGKGVLRLHAQAPQGMEKKGRDKVLCKKKDASAKHGDKTDFPFGAYAGSLRDG